MEALTNLVNQINAIVWGPLMLILILGTGFFLQIGLRMMPILKLGFGFRLLWRGRKPEAVAGDISPFNALFAGAAIWTAIRFGVARGIFSNEAGLGSAPIAHAAAITKGPVNQGLVAMLGTFIDTIIVCSITGLAIVTTGVWTSGDTGAPLTSAAFEAALPGTGGYMVTCGLAIFAFTTMLGWSFYGEKCVEYLFGVKSIHPFRILWILAIPVGAMGDLGFIWLLADTLNALMAIPNLIALLLLSPLIFKLTKEFMASGGATEEPGAKTGVAS